MLIFDKGYLEYVRRILRGKMEAQHSPTELSWSYRKRASALAREADSCDQIEQQVDLIKQALSWIQLAENEEFLALHKPRANDN